MDVHEINYHSIKQKMISGRYITFDHITGILDSLSKKSHVAIIGCSVNGIPINSITIGNGPKKILMWSQMHGNESTTTKAVFDLINFLDSNSRLSISILENCTIRIIPMLNPDGAQAYTRVNANNIDLNRDAQDRSQPESNVLRDCFEEFKPDFCFNLHDQRTIFNVGNTPKPATVSFLAPAHDAKRSISKSRALGMKLIVAMNKQLQELIPGQIGRYDDVFNANCVGDTFQMLNIPTILFEAGHYFDDYEREITRQYVFIALVTALKVISENTIHKFVEEDYLKIPENSKLFYDVLINNAHIIDPKLYGHEDSIGIIFKEFLQDATIKFEPLVDKTENLQDYFGHKVYNCAIEKDLQELKSRSFWKGLSH